MKQLKLAELGIFSFKIEFWAFRRQNNCNLSNTQLF